MVGDGSGGRHAWKSIESVGICGVRSIHGLFRANPVPGPSGERLFHIFLLLIAFRLALRGDVKDWICEMGEKAKYAAKNRRNMKKNSSTKGHEDSRRMSENIQRPNIQPPS
jgi:hypothetical protein